MYVVEIREKMFIHVKWENAKSYLEGYLRKQKISKGPIILRKSFILKERMSMLNQYNF